MALKHPVSFSHPLMPEPLVVSVQPDQITWAYGLNTASYSTYAGEVLQILSVYFDDMTISGTIATYTEMESIYRWFVNYLQIATAGQGGNGSYDLRPVVFDYPHRGWKFDLWPKQLPGFKYGAEVVAPTWTVIAAVAEPEPGLTAAIMTQAQLDAQTGGEFTTFGLATADIGFTEDNPFSAPPTDEATRDAAIKDLSGVYSGLTNGDYSSLEASKPPDWATGDLTKKVKQAAGAVNGAKDVLGALFNNG